MQQEEIGKEITPPPRHPRSAVLTPPPTDERLFSGVQRAVRTIKRHREGRRTLKGSWSSVYIDPKDLPELETLLSKDEYLSNKLRCGYFPQRKLMVLRMPTRVRERFLIQVHDEIRRQLASLAEGPARDFVKHIVFEGSTTYRPVDSEYGRHDPDGSFRHVHEQYPGLVTEGAYAQVGKMLQDIAEDYILGSNLRVRCMAAFDLSYRDTEATVSTWRSRMHREADEEVWSVCSDTQIFRHKNGDPNLDPKAGLKISLHDFATPKRCQKFEHLDQTIFIPCRELCSYLINAEAPVAAQSSSNSPEPNLRKRRRTPSPNDLRSEDERRILAHEERQASRLEARESSYEDTSSEQSTAA